VEVERLEVVPQAQQRDQGAEAGLINRQMLLYVARPAGLDAGRPVVRDATLLDSLMCQWEAQQRILGERNGFAAVATNRTEAHAFSAITAAGQDRQVWQRLQ
jgi:hypothetical protein